MGKKLSDKQKLFCNHYLANGCHGTDAAIKAGYSEKSARSGASILLDKPEIQEYIQLKQNKTKEKLNITRESLLTDLQKAKQIAEENGKASDLVRACEAQAKMLGLNEPDKVETTIKDKTIELDLGDKTITLA